MHFRAGNRRGAIVIGFVLAVLLYALPLAHAALIGDINHDARVDILDVQFIVLDLNRVGSALPTDLNGDGAVNVLDLVRLSANWGRVEDLHEYTTETPRAADSFVDFLGVNIHLHYNRLPYFNNFSDLIKPRLQELGVRHVRDAALATNVWSNAIQHSRINELHTDLGITFTLTVDYANPLNDTLASLRGTASALYGIEGPNEYDNRFPQDNVAWVPAMKLFIQNMSAQLDADPVLTGFPVLSPSFLRRTTAAPMGDISAYIDYASIHPYPYPDSPLTNGAMTYFMTNLKPMYGNRGHIITETGYHTGGVGSDRPISELAQSKYIPRLQLEQFNIGIVQSYLYELLDEGTNATNREDHFGLLRADGSRKPAFTAMKNLIGLLSDPGAPFAPTAFSYNLTGDLTNVHHTLLQKRDGRVYLILWLEVTDWDKAAFTDIAVPGRSLTLSLPQPAAGIAQYTPVLGSTPLAEQHGVNGAQLVISDDILVVEMTP